MTNVVIKSLWWSDAARRRIEMMLDGVFDGQTIQFTYDPDDTSPVSLAVRDLLAKNKYDIGDPRP